MKYLIRFLALLIIPFITFAQTSPKQQTHPLLKRITKAPDSVFAMFINAGMHPVDHPLTEAELALIDKSFKMLPPGILKLLETNLGSISFMDSMPNTALTSPLMPNQGPKQFNITFRAGILNETVSEWATKKENTIFRKYGDTAFQVKVNAGNLNAFVYVLLHEATHVVDAILKLTPHPDSLTDNNQQTEYTINVWKSMNKPLPVYVDSLIEETIFRGGAPIDIRLAPEIYTRLLKTPFPSLYGAAAWFEDLAELEAIYHLTNKLNQPFEVIVLRNNKVVARYEPSKNPLVRSRFKYLAPFYRN